MKIEKIEKNESDFLRCPDCHEKFTQLLDDRLKCVACERTYEKIGRIYKLLPKNVADSTQLSTEKWDEFYSAADKKNYEERFALYMKQDFPNVEKQLLPYFGDTQGQVFLEIGCGPMYLARALAKKFKLVIGIDFSLEALFTAEKMLKSSNVENYILIHGDINNMPLINDCVDLLYGGGVIEHFKSTQKCVNELYRVLRKNGISFNTVPCLNLGSLTYRQLWGNIPDFPILKQIAEFIHINLLKSRHMTFGYELSFLPSRMITLHKNAGFSAVKVEKWSTKLLFEFIKIPQIKKILIYLADTSPLFWPMIKVVGIK